MEQELIADMVKLGCSDKLIATLTYQVYVDLIEIKKFFDVTYHFSDQLQTMYITARETKNDIVNTYIPISSLDSVSMNRMFELIEIAAEGTKSVYLAMIAPDTTCVYYKLTDGILPVSQINLEGPRFATRQKHDKELFKRKDDLRKAAVMKIPFNLNKQEENQTLNT